MEHKKYRDLIQVSLIIILTAAGGGLLWAARNVAGFAEWYSKTVYPVIVGIIGRFWGVLPISIVELMLYGGAVLLIYLMFRYWKHPWVLVKHYAFTVSLLLFLYAACCGVNYYRIPFSSYYIAGLQEKVKEKQISYEPTQTLRELCLWLTEQVNRARVELDAAEGNYLKMQKKGVDAMKQLADQYPSLSGYYPQPKPVLISWILSIQQCSGVYSPFTIEANYNKDMIAYNIPHTICHELSHLRGFMREDEANFIGYLACLESDEADYRYSGYLLGWIYAGNALARVDYEEYNRIYRLLDEKITEDLDHNNDFWDRYEGEIAEVQEKVNDAYLKANGQADGVLSYGRVVDLMLIDYVLNRKES